MGTQKTTIPLVLEVPNHHSEIPKSYNYRLQDQILSRNVTKEEYHKHQLQHKKIPRDIEFYDEHGSPVTYRIQHDDNPNDTCNDFYTINCQQGNDNKVLRLQDDGEKITLSSLSTELPTATIQSPTDFFRLGGTINQFRRLCLPST